MMNKAEAFARLRELLIKQNECKAKTYRIEQYVEALVQQVEAKPQRRDDIMREIEQC